DVPYHADDYVHRIGRTGRAGLTGETYMIVTPNDAKALDKVLKLIKVEPDEVKLDLDWSLAEGGDERRDRPGRGGRGERSRGGEGGSKERAPREGRRSGSYGQGVAEAAPDAPASADVAVAESSPAGAERSEPRPRREDRPEREPRTEREPRAEREPREARGPREPREARDREPRDREPRDREPRAREPRERGYGDRDRSEPRDNVVGFGSDTPAFLTRAAPLAPAKKATALAKE
ncbi:MAG: hypothetical protein ABIO37_10985, partial [Caulobacteraceae bacterium]